MRIYLYSFFDRENMLFHNVAKQTKAAADSEAWDYFKAALENYIADDQFVETVTADNIEEFSSQEYNYIALADIGGLECQYEEIEF